MKSCDHLTSEGPVQDPPEVLTVSPWTSITDRPSAAGPKTENTLRFYFEIPGKDFLDGGTVQMSPGLRDRLFEAFYVTILMTLLNWFVLLLW